MGGHEKTLRSTHLTKQGEQLSLHSPIVPFWLLRPFGISSDLHQILSQPHALPFGKAANWPGILQEWLQKCCLVTADNLSPWACTPIDCGPNVEVVTRAAPVKTAALGGGRPDLLQQRGRHIQAPVRQCLDGHQGCEAIHTVKCGRKGAWPRGLPRVSQSSRPRR